MKKWTRVKHTVWSKNTIIKIAKIEALFIIISIFLATYFMPKTSLATAFEPSIEYFFSNDGADTNTGLSPDSPLKDPTPYFNIPGASLLLKSGDIFLLNEINITSSNLMISTYGGSEKAVISGLRTLNNTFVHAYDDVYSIVLDDAEIGAIVENGRHNWSRVSKQDYLLNSGDYYFDKESQTLYRKSNDNIEGTTVQYSVGQNGIKLVGASNVSIQNIEICSFGRHGVNIGSNCSNIIINGCFVHDIGGSELLTNTKYGNAIQVWSDNCHDITISNNTVNNIYDTGITAQNSKASGASGNSTNIVISNNVISKCYWGMEFYNYQQSFSAECFVDGNNVTDIMDITNGYRWDKSGVIGEKGGANALRFVGVNSNDRYYITNNVFADSEDAALFITQDISGGIAQFSNNVFASIVPIFTVDTSYYDDDSDVLYFSSYDEYIANENGSNVIEDEDAAKSDKLQIRNDLTMIFVGFLLLNVIMGILFMIKRGKRKDVGK
ncbi:right-handed parallel beta-helix repeat-containing protein [Butyrivibrio sp. MC2013]|uniref:right-handed parallel beta-helix repeat-containing protein n=1 Tax=Butyrivibrio sp. MC2013 TaxID=1280686 RepID=UPI00040A0E4A|nr:right-handed parallel beta-helix repeat-containing protein [Butyrivibrio sp. MC2013]